MASNSETGHAVNGANFKKLVDHCDSYAAYNPSKNKLKIPALKAQHTAAAGLQGTVDTQWALIKDPINDRQELYKPLSPLVTRIVNSLSNTDATPLEIADIKTIADDIRGISSKKEKTTEQPQAQDDVSTSHMSYVRRAQNFGKLVALLDTIPSYTPNETNLKLVTLNAYNLQLNTANDEITPKLTPYYNALISRNNSFYLTPGGLIDTAYQVKDYVASMTDLGVKAAEYKTVAKIKFKRYSE